MAFRRWLAKWYLSILFNLGEMLAIFLTGYWLLAAWELPLYVMLTFTVARLGIGKAKHYRQWQLCLVWSYVVFLSLFVVASADIIISALLAVFTAFLLSDRNKIKDLTQLAWPQGGQSKYYREYARVRADPQNPELKALEERLKFDDEVKHHVYCCIFRDEWSWEKTANALGMDSRRLEPSVDSVALAVRIVLKM